MLRPLAIALAAALAAAVVIVVGYAMLRPAPETRQARESAAARAATQDFPRLKLDHNLSIAPER